MKILIIAAHPNLGESRVNKAWLNSIQKEENVTVHDLYEAYPNFKIDVKKEQQLLLNHDRIVFQFPFYWYSSPALLKQWQDAVLEYGFAYGSNGTALHGKELLLAISTGGPAEAYKEGGYNKFEIKALTLPFQATANLTGMTLLPSFLLQGVHSVTEEMLEESAAAYAEYILNPKLQTV